MAKDKKTEKSDENTDLTQNNETSDFEVSDIKPDNNENIAKETADKENKSSKQNKINDILNFEDELDSVTVRPVEFMSFDEDSKPYGEENKNLEMLMDIKLELTVELGRCELPIKKILELTRDSIIELDKIAGEPVSLYANGKHIANGEVVVIEDNFGLRITSILEPEKRLKSLN